MTSETSVSDSLQKKNMRSSTQRARRSEARRAELDRLLGKTPSVAEHDDSTNTSRDTSRVDASRLRLNLVEHQRHHLRL